MKFAIDERVKHRLTGVVVIISIAAIFVPAMMKKSNQHFDDSVRVSVHLPKKPMPPKLSMQNEKTLFKAIKPALIDKPTAITVPTVSQIAKAEPIRKKSTIAPIVAEKKPSTVAKITPTVNKTPLVAKTVPTNNKASSTTKDMVKSIAVKAVPGVAIKKDTYSVQLASFTKQSNAESLVSRLRSQGYKASYNKILSKQGEYYKVVVGQLDGRDAAVNLQNKLASSMQLRGFIVKTGVS